MKPHEAPAADRIGTLPKGLGLAVGESVPDVSLKDAHGKDVRLRELTAGSPTLLVFYRGGWCPFCNFQIHELTEAHPEFKRRGVTPVAVSVDRIDEAARTKATYEIPFPVLSDPDLAAHQAFRVTHVADAAEIERLKGFGMDIDKYSGRTHHTIAVPSIFVLDRQGVVRWAHADADYKVRPSVVQLLAVLDTLSLTEANAAAK